jgi:hypothetical protein
MRKRKTPGGDFHKTKLDAMQTQRLLFLYQTGEYTQENLSKRFSVATSTIRRILEKFEGTEHIESRPNARPVVHNSNSLIWIGKKANAEVAHPKVDRR